MNKLAKAREFSFQYLFHLQLSVFNELKQQILSENFENIEESIAEFNESIAISLDPDQFKYSKNLITGTLKHNDELAELVSKYLKNWKLDRISKTDRTVLLLSTFELKCIPETPVSVVINEAIEISKKFGTADSGNFINGILDNIAKKEL